MRYRFSFYFYSIFVVISDDNASDCATSYYSESDPFDYLYSCGTQYSDPVYEAVNKIDRTPLSPGNEMAFLAMLYINSNYLPQLFAGAPQIGWNIPSGSSLILPPPPLPPRNHNKSNIEDYESPVQIEYNQINIDLPKKSAKLYENVVNKNTYDPELVAFYQMVKDIRSQYTYIDGETNVGHVVAAEFNNVYPVGTSIKLLVHPAFECVQAQITAAIGTEYKGQIEGYAAPVVFTCDSKSLWVLLHFGIARVFFVVGFDIIRYLFTFSLHNCRTCDNARFL